MLAEGEARAKTAGIANIAWRQADPAMAALDAYDLLTSAFGVMFFAAPWGPLPTCAVPPPLAREWRLCAGER
jgi:hypothetical protein